MSTEKLITIYNEILHDFDRATDVGPLFYYNRDTKLMDSLIKDHIFPPFYATYNSNAKIPAIKIVIDSKGSYDCYLYDDAEGGDRCYIKKIWGHVSKDDVLNIAATLYRYVDLADIIVPHVSKIVRLERNLSIGDIFNFEQSLELLKLKSSKENKSGKMRTAG